MRKAPLGSGQGEQGCPSPPRCDDEQLSARGVVRTVDVLGERDILSPPGSGRERCGQRERGDTLCACMEAGVGGQRSAETLRA